MNSLNITSKSWLAQIRKEKEEAREPDHIPLAILFLAKLEQHKEFLVSRKEPIGVGVWRKPLERFPKKQKFGAKFHNIQEASTMNEVEFSISD